MRGGVMQLHRWGVLPRLRRREPPVIARDDVPLRRRRRADRHPPCAWRGGAVRTAPHTARQYAGGYRGAGRRDGAVWPYVGAPAAPARWPRLWRDGAGCGGQGQDNQGRPRCRRGRHRSSVARLSGAPIVREARNTTAVVYGHFQELDLTGSHWWFRAGISAGAIPTNHGRHCIFVAMPPGRLRTGLWRDDRMAAFREALAEVDPDLAASVARPRLTRRCTYSPDTRATYARRSGQAGRWSATRALQGPTDRAWHHRRLA